MKQSINSSIRFLLVITLFFGGLYTVFLTGIGQIFFQEQTSGSLVKNSEGGVMGSRLIGQQFTGNQYFKGRAAEVSQLSPISSKQKQVVEERRNVLLKENPKVKDIPIDLVTASGSGLDPHISLEAANLQVDRIANARMISKKEIYDIIKTYTIQDPFSNQRYLNVLEMNLELDLLRE